MSWVDVCRLERITPDRGVAALVAGEAVAVFRLADGELCAIDHVDPFTGSPVLARGLVGSADGCTFVASPLLKQRFDLSTGTCLDDPTRSVQVWPVRVLDGRVQLAARNNT